MSQQPAPLEAARTCLSTVCLYSCSVNPSGMGVHMLALARHLAEAGLRVVLAYWPADAAEPLLSQAEEYGARIARTPHPRDPAYSRELVALLRDAAPDVFHVHVGTGREDFGGARAARVAGVPATVETLHLPWMRARGKCGSMLHSLEEVDQLIVVSEAQRATYERIGIAADRMITVPNGVVPRGDGPGRAAARRALGLEADRPVLVTVGRLVAQKGHRHLIDAVPRLLPSWPDLTVLIVGDGSLRADLERRARDLGVHHAVRLLGHRPDARDLLDAADVFVLPSRQEAMPMAALEAMEAGLPVVATRVTGTTEVVQDGVTGRLVRPDDPAALAQALAEVLADDDLRRRLGARGREVFARRFTAARMTAETLAVYRRTLERRARAWSAAEVAQ